MKASSQGTQERPFLLQSFSPLSRFFLCVPLFQSLVSPTVSFPAPPVAVSSAAVSCPACLGCGPAALPGRPPWLPLCGSQQAPPPAPLHPASDPSVDSEVGCLSHGPWDQGQTTAPWHPQRLPLSPNQGAPSGGHGGGPPHQVCASTQGPAEPSPPALLHRPHPPLPQHPCPQRGPLKEVLSFHQRQAQRQENLPPGSVPPPLTPSPCYAFSHWLPSFQTKPLSLSLSVSFSLFPPLLCLSHLSASLCLHNFISPCRRFLKHFFSLFHFPNCLVYLCLLCLPPSRSLSPPLSGCLPPSVSESLSCHRLSPFLSGSLSFLKVSVPFPLDLCPFASGSLSCLVPVLFLGAPSQHPSSFPSLHVLVFLQSLLSNLPSSPHW
ncbi:extensin-like [Papio anubis]|uniref:extensin-like n=1 Tax=Papio anubis TaxID=9555 RepID=UPI0012AD2772|nr:extensin-like [Papio anubis]